MKGKLTGVTWRTAPCGVYIYLYAESGFKVNLETVTQKQIHNSNASVSIYIRLLSNVRPHNVKIAHVMLVYGSLNMVHYVYVYDINWYVL